MSASDPEACNDACRLVMVLPALILGRHSAGPEQARPGAAWIDVVEARIRRLLNGEFIELFEAIATGAPPRREADSDIDPRIGKVKRALQRARQGSVSKAVGALRGGGILPLEQERVRLAFAGLLVPHLGNDPLPFAQAARLVDGSPSPDSDMFKFTPTVSMVPGPNGELIEVPTLDWSMQHLDPTSAPGISGLSNMILKRLSPAVVGPLLRPYFGTGVWDYSIPSHKVTHQLLISVRGVALDKNGEGYSPDREVNNLRPICIGESLRRLAGRCQLLQLEGQIGERLAPSGQYGVGFANGTDTVYQLVARALDAFVAAEVAGGTAETDARNAFCSIFRDAIQRGVIKHAPELLATLNFLYGLDAVGLCYLYGPGQSVPLGSYPLPVGVQQGDVFGPLFFALGLDELLAAVRERMRNLPVDSTFVNQPVFVTGAVDGALLNAPPEPGGAVVVPVRQGMPLRLVEAPSYLDIEAAGDRSSLRVAVLVGEGASSYRVSLPWESVRFGTEILLAAYLDDIHFPGEAFLLRPFTLILRELGPTIGLHFVSLSKNYAYIPRDYEVEVRRLYPDASIITDATPGTPKVQFEAGARALTGDLRRLLITHVGIPKIMGAPLRTACAAMSGSTCLNDDVAWVKARAKEVAAEAMLFFAHLGLEGVDAAASEYVGHDTYDSYKRAAATLPEDESQIKFFLARYSFMSRLQCVARSLPSSVSSDPLHAVDLLAVETAAACAGLTSARELTADQQGRIVLPTRFGGIIPGNAIVAPASSVCAAANVDDYLLRVAPTGGRPELWIMARMRDRAVGRALAAGGAAPRLTPAELELQRDVVQINAASADPRVRAFLRRSAESSADPGAEQPVDAAAPVPDLLNLSNLSETRVSSRQLCDFLWVRQFLRISDGASPLGRAKMLEGCLPGAGLSFAAVPSVPAFDLPHATFKRLLQNYLGIVGHRLPHTHHCGGGHVVQLDGDNSHHIQVCPMLGRGKLAHDELKNSLAHALLACGVASEVRTEVRLGARGEDGVGLTYNGDLVYFLPDGRRVLLECSRLTITQSSIAGSGSLAGPSSVLNLLRIAENARRDHARASAIVENDEGNTLFIPIVLTSCGGFGPSARAFLKEVFKTAQANGRWAMASGQPEVLTTWNTFYASTYWNMRLSVAGAVMDAHVQNDILLRDRTRNLVVVGRQPHPNPNHSSYSSVGRPRRGVTAAPLGVV